MGGVPILWSKARRKKITEKRGERRIFGNLTKEKIKGGNIYRQKIGPNWRSGLRKEIVRGPLQILGPNRKLGSERACHKSRA
jgi:hypothetical protein